MKIKKLPIKIDHLEKIFHIADIHIRLFKRKDEYRQVFNNLYDVIKGEGIENTILVIAGDVVHAKTEMSPEMIDLTSDLFSELGNILPTIITAGNHDANLNNTSRLDAIYPIIKALKHPNVFYLRETGLYEVGNTIFSVMSIFDDVSKYIMANAIHSDKTKIAIFHGPVNLASIDSGWKVTNDKISTSLFDGYDIALLGDIHKYQMLQPYTIVNGIKKPAVCYPSSLVQQNYGESLEKHGMLIWDVNSRQHEFRKVKNEFGFVTIEIDDGKIISDIPLEMPEKARMRLHVKGTNQTQLKECLISLRAQYKPIEVIINRTSHKADFEESGNRIDLTNIREVSFQNTLLEDYLTRNYNLTAEEFERVYEINEQLNKKLPTQETIRNVTWKPKMFKFSNMFSYGAGNIIDFSKMNGIVGLFSANASGKTSLIESLTFCLFDKCSKAFKASHILNNRKDKFVCELLFEIADQDYVIRRTATRVSSGNVNVKVDFYKILPNGLLHSLNGEHRRDTDNIIRSYIGAYEDFILTAVSSQSNPANFVDKSQTERKDLLAAFMDITIFDQLYDIGSNEMKEYDILLKQYQKNDYEGEISEYEGKIEKYNNEYLMLKLNKDSLSIEKTKLGDAIGLLYQEIIGVDNEIVNITQLESNKKSLEESIAKNEPEFKSIQSNITKMVSEYDEVVKQVKDFEATDINKRHEHYNHILQQYKDVDGEFERIKINVKHKLEKTKKLRELEYDPNCTYCMNNIFVKDAIDAKKELADDKKNAELVVETKESLKAEVDKMSGIDEEYKKYTISINEMKRMKMELLQLDSKKSMITNEISTYKNELEKTTIKIEKYYKSKEDIEKNKITEEKITDLKSKITDLNVELNDTEDELRDAHSKMVFLEDKKKIAKESLEKFKEMEEKNVSYQYYLQAIQRDSIPYELISRAIPEIEREVNNILSQVVDFAVMLDLDGKNINVKMVYDEEKIWPMELASGMEKFVVGIAIRVALLGISNLPRPNFLAIDEGFSTLDADNSANLPMVFDYLKSHFDFIFLISHMDYIRDFVDISLDLKKQDDFSKIVFKP